VEIRRRLRQRGEIGRLFQRQVLERRVEIGLRGGGHAIGVLAEENLVEVEFENAFLRQRSLDPGGEDDLAHLAFDGPAAVEKEVLHHLLGDRGGAAHRLAAGLHRLHEGGGDGAGVVALVFPEIPVLGRDEGIGDHVGNFLRRDEETAFGGEFVHHDALARIDPADRRRGVVRQGLMVRQIVAVEEQEPPDPQRSGHEAERDGAERGAENPHDETDHVQNPMLPSGPSARIRRNPDLSAPLARSSAGSLALYARTHNGSKPARRVPGRVFAQS
jgi:hypothetical protein